MFLIILAVLALTIILYLIDSRLLAGKQTRNVIMFALASLGALGVTSLIAYKMNFPSVNIAAMILLPLSLLFGAWFGWFRNRVFSAIK